MRIWPAAGPARVSTRGRIAVRLEVLAALALLFVAAMWPLALFGHALGLTPSVHQLMDRGHVWMHHHYPLLALRYVGAASALLAIVGLTAFPVIRLADLTAARQEQGPYRRAATARPAVRPENRQPPRKVPSRAL